LACIIHRISCPHTHQQNRIIERKHRHIIETGIALLAHSSLPQCYWVDAFQTASFLINRMLTTVLKNKSPLEVLFHKPPDYSLLKVFGCLCWPCLRPYTSHKLDFRSLPCVFLGYSPSHKGYRCLHLPTNRLYIYLAMSFLMKHNFLFLLLLLIVCCRTHQHQYLLISQCQLVHHLLLPQYPLSL
jgi:hypothetical protein